MENIPAQPSSLETDQSVNSNPPTTPEPAPSPTPTTSRRWLIGLTALVLLMLGGLGVMAYQNYQLQQQITQKPVVPTNEVTAEPTEDETADWRSHTDFQTGFYFKYPPTMDYECCAMSGPAGSSSTPMFTVAVPETIVPNSDAPFTGLSIYTVPTAGNSFEQYISNQKQILQDNYMAMMGNQPDQSGSESALTIGGKPAILLKDFSWDKIDRIYVDLGNYRALVIGKRVTSEEYAALIEKILTTIKFKDVAMTDKADLKECESPAMKIRASVPKDWNCSTTNETEGFGWLEMKTSAVEITISNAGRGPFCSVRMMEGPALDDSRCMLTKFYSNPGNEMDLYLYQYDGINKEIWGTMNGPWISIKWSEMENRDLSPLEIDQVGEILNSIAVVQ